MLSIRKLSFVFPVIFAILLISAARCQSDQSELINRLLRTSGLASQIEQIHSAVWAAVPADAFSNDTQRNDALRGFKKTVTTDELMSLLREQIMNSFQEEKIEALIKFFETALGRKLSRIQKDMLNTNNLKAIRESRRIAALLEGKRLELISRIMELNRAAEINTQLTSTLIDAMIMKEPLRRADSESSGTTLDRHEPQAALEKNLVDETMILSYANNLKTFDENELTALVSFYETPEADWFRTVSNSFMRHAVRELGIALSRSLANQSVQTR